MKLRNPCVFKSYTSNSFLTRTTQVVIQMCITASCRASWNQQ